MERLEDRLAPSGDFGYALTLGGTGSDQASEVATDAAGNVYVTGQFQGTVDFDPDPGNMVNLTSAGGTDAFLAKFSPSGSLVWARRMGGTGNDRGTALAVDAAGNAVVAGDFAGTADFGALPSLVSVSSGGTSTTDAYMTKLDGSGNFLWAKQVGGTGADTPRAVDVDAQGNVYIVGDFTATADFDPGAGTVTRTPLGGSQSDVFVLKLTPSGTYTWVQTFGSTAGDLGQGIAVDGSGNVYTTGVYRGGSNDFDPGAGTTTLPYAGLTDVFVSKLGADGTLAWVKGFGASGSDTVTAIAVDAAGNAFLTGTFAGTVDFNPDPAVNFNLTSVGTNTTTGAPLPDVYIAKLDSAGGLAWAGRIGGAGAPETVGDLTLDLAGNVYITGSFGLVADFDPDPTQVYALTGSLAGPPAAASTDSYVLKLGNDGHFVWARDTSGLGSETGLGVATDNRGHVYAVGIFSGTSDFDPDPVNVAERTSVAGTTGAPSLDAFLLQLSSGTAVQQTTADGYAIDANHDGTYESVTTTDNFIYTRENSSYSWRGLMEFDLSGLDPGLIVKSATLTVRPIVLEYNNLQNGVDIAIYGYTGDGTITPADGSAPATLLGQALNVGLNPLTITLDPAAVQALLASGSKPGLMVRLLRGDGVALASLESPFNAPATLALQLDTAGTRPPRSRNDAYYLDEDTTLTVPLSASVLDNDDTDRAPLTATLLTGPQTGTLTFNPDGTFSYTPPPNFSATQDPNSLVSFTYRANDGTADGNVATVFLIVNPVNDPPTAVADSYSTNEDVQLNVAAPGVLANDTDIDSTNLTAAVASNPAHGTVTLFNDGSFIYRPATDYNGPDSFTYRTSDGQAFSTPVTVSITVNPVNDAPQFILVNGTATASEDAGAQSFPNYTTNILPGPTTAVDEAGQAVHFELTITGTTGGLTFSQAPAIGPNGTLTFTSAPNSNGTATVSAVLVDNGGTSNGGVDRSTARTFTIVVNPVNDPPTAGNDSYTTNAGSPLTIAAPGVLSNDADVDGNPLTAVLGTGPAHGSLTFPGNGGFTYTPDPNFFGTDTFTYSASDNLTTSSLATVTINVVSAILDNGNQGFTQTGSWWQYVGPGSYNNNVAYTPAGNGSAQTTWQFAGIVAGTYDLQVTWVPDPSRASNAPYQIYEGNTLLRTVLLDQRPAPLGPVVGGVMFQSLGTVTLTGSGPLRVVLSNNADGIVIADALRVAPVVTLPTVLDNGDQGFRQTGSWWQYAGPGSYNNNVAYTPAGDGSAQTTWQFAGIVAGTYDLQVTWVADPSRASNAPYQIYEGNTLLQTVFLDQRPAPVGPIIGGVAFQSLGLVTLTGAGPLRVVLSNNANGFVIADALRVVQASPLRVEGGASTGPAPASSLGSQDLAPIIDEAINRWQEAGVDPASLAALRAAPIWIADLSGDTLGLADADGITIDRDAAGYGWFVDPTPGDDSEFALGAANPAPAGIDLLSVLEHEFGHLLGLNDVDDDGTDNVMAETLGPGVRRVVRL